MKWKHVHCTIVKDRIPLKFVKSGIHSSVLLLLPFFKGGAGLEQEH